MDIEKRLKQDGVTVVVRNTMRQEMRRREMLKALDGWINEPCIDQNERVTWFVCNAFTVSVKGLKWDICAALDRDALLASYNAFIDAVPPAFGDEWYELIDSLRRPDASLLDRKDDELTDSEKNDPNS